MPVLTPTTVRALLADHDLSPNRALGQHFLADPNTARRIARLAELQPGESVLEIGPGLGSLTVALAETGAHVVAVELDRNLVPLVEATVAGAGDVRVVQGDALHLDVAALGPGPWACVSNLPYNIAAPVVVRLLETAPSVTRLLVMTQREVGERLAARPGDPAAGAVSAKVAYYAEARVVGAVSPSVFVPAPHIESVLVRLDRRAAPPVAVDPERLFGLVRAGFAQRRKMLRGALRPLLGPRADSALTAAGIPPTARAENLTLDEWAGLAEAVDTSP
ncbi:MAG TPA: 16S rRNA (adenine(1518)-N(6)/adenine(1519)-N(6))-dimethyltransferase RsmA [Acidimicrobiia bacterium]|nr:16S rRNA (adenine(1518)-N(6)/adenine(1519)-N(6))-dimethyltransferase RsmA [Acidimicrobiia bacterium]